MESSKLMSIESTLLYLVRQLRRAGVRVTLAEVLDCFRALALIEWDKPKFYITLQSTLIKSPKDLSVYDKLFRLVFNEEFFNGEQRGQNELETGSEAVSPCLTCNGTGQGGISSGQYHPGVMSQRMLQLILVGNCKAMAEFVDEGITSLGPLTEEHLKMPQDALRLVKVYLEWKTAEWEIAKLTTEADEQLALPWLERLHELEEMLQLQWDQALLANFGDRGMEVITERINLQELDFYRLNRNQIKAMKAIITRLAHKLATRVSRRYTRAKRGQIDLARTMRQAMSTGGIPVYLRYRQKKPTKPELVVLCDLSGSVAVFSEFMLQLVYSMQQKFRHVRSFVFVDTIEEISSLFSKLEIEDALVEVYNNGKYSKTGFSHYGETIQYFWQHYNEAVTKNTTILILGDARNNYQNPDLEGWMLGKQKAKRVIWLNPEPINRWNKEDSIIDTFAQACTQVMECRNLGQLEVVTRNLF
ncbi:MAG: VWA domain-containing protein [Carboxydocellales bacterium]